MPRYGVEALPFHGASVQAETPEQLYQSKLVAAVVVVELLLEAAWAATSSHMCIGSKCAVRSPACRA